MEGRYLFKAKRIDNGEWITGYLLVKKKDFYICEKPYECMDEYSSLNGQSYGFGCFKFVDQSTICQCTGLKDKNGKLIWENEIIKCKFGIAVAVWDKSEWRIKWVEDNIWRKDLHYWVVEDNQRTEVIGNIFDNPELLEIEE